MKNIAIYGKSISENNLKFLENLIDALNKELSPEIFFHDSLKVYTSLVDKLNISFFGDQDLVKNKIDLLISFGGDGTLLDTVTMIKDSNIPVLGINAGRLGFLANITQEDIILAVKALKNKDYKLDQRSLVQVKNKSLISNESSNFALNEINIHFPPI